MIGAPTRRRQAKGEVREAKFYYVGINPYADELVPKVGNTVAWCPSYQPLDITQPASPSEVTEVRADWIGGSQPDTEGNGTDTTAWMIYVTAKCGEEDDGSGGGGTTNSPENLEKRVKKSYSLKEIYLDPIWWGMLKADEKKAGVTPWKTIKDTKKKKEFEYYHWILNIFGNDCKEGDSIFKNAAIGQKVLEIDTSGTSPSFGSKTTHTNPGTNNGTTNINFSPYGDTGPSKGPTDDNIKSAGTKCKVVIYTVTYYEKAISYDGFLDWTGLSPEGDSAFSKKCTPNYGLDNKGSNRKHFWKAVDVRVNKIKDTNQDTWIEITRQCEAAPFLPSDQWKWNADKAVWGEWTW
jgi:hypothetical protein